MAGREAVPAGAAAVYSTTSDMARYAAALLGGGAGEHGQMLQPETLATMFRPYYQPDPRIPGMGLGFFRGHAGFGSGTSQVVFSRGPAGEVTAMHLGVQPLSFRKRPGIQKPQTLSGRRARGRRPGNRRGVSAPPRARSPTDLYARPS